MKKASIIIFVVFSLCGTLLPLWSQSIADPNSALYTDLSLWQSRGLISRLPPLRPYPIQLVKQYLAEVEQRGDASDRKRAADYLSQITGTINAHVVATTEGRTDFSKHFEEIGLAADLQGSFNPKLTYSARVGAKAASGDGNSLLPEYQRSTENYQYSTSVSPIGSTGLTPQLSMTSMTAFGSGSAYLQAGIMRSSFGPFFGDSAVMSPFAPQAGIASFTWQQGLFTYTQLFQALTATNNDGTASTTSYDKYLALNSLEFYPLSWLSFGIFESVVWGHRLEPLYLLPVPTILFYAQGLHGYPDNSLLGLSASAKLPYSIDASALLYVDDAGFNQLIRLDFNSMFLAAFQGGLSWTPNLPFLTRLSANYLLVTPYTYSHLDSGTATATNYQNYTNDGQNIGPSLQPNSDRIELKALVRPTPFLDLTLFGRYIRHGNASQGVITGNGTIFDPGYDGTSPTFTVGYKLPPGITRYTRFLTQGVLEKTLQTGLSATARFKTPIGEVSGTLSYTFEYVRNAINGWGDGYPTGTSSNGNPVAGNNLTNNYLTLSFELRYP